MTKPKIDGHKRERPGIGIEHEVEDVDHLVANCLAAGPNTARRMLDAMPCSKVNRRRLPGWSRRLGEERADICCGTAGALQCKDAGGEVNGVDQASYV
jgi:hypothetical protein